jgi:Putative beta-lactamase-inhibitor-like, PepSY-like
MTLGTLTKSSALVLVGALGVARGDEEKLSPDKLPAAVKAAIMARFPGAELKGASKESEGGETIFEVMLTYKGDKYDVAVESNGEIEEIERAIFVDALPSAVLKAIKAKYPKAKIKEAEEVTDEDGEVCYEVAIAHDGEDVEVAVTPKGKIKKGDEDDKGEKKEKKEKKDDEGEKKEKSKKDKD